MSATEQELDRRVRELLAPLDDVPAVALRERPVGSRRPVLVGALGLALLLAAIALIVAGHRKASAPALPSGAPSIVYSKAVVPDGPSLIYRARPDGTDPVQIAEGQMPVLSPDGTQVAFATVLPGGAMRLLVVSVAGGASRVVWSSSAGLVVLGWSGDGRVLVAPGLFAIDIATGQRRVITRRPVQSASGSRDGSSVVYARIRALGTDIVVASIPGGRAVALTDGGDNTNPVWGARGIAYESYDKGRWTLWLARPDGAVRRPLARAKHELRPVAFSADGSRLLVEQPPNHNGQAFVLDLRGGRLGPLTQLRGDVSAVALSSDGRTAYIRIAGCGGVPSPGVIAAMPATGGRQHVVARGTCTVSAH